MSVTRPDNGEPLDESRLFKYGPTLSVYVPPKPPPTPDDWKQDFPPGYPPEVRFNGVNANYWVVVETGQMEYMGGTKKFSEEHMEWLRSLREKIEAIIRKDC